MSLWILFSSALIGLLVAVLTGTSYAGTSDDDPVAVDYLTFARGAVPVAMTGDAATLKLGSSESLQPIDGDDRGFVLTPKPGGPNTELSFIYRLPAATTFTEFAVPTWRETPSPSQTFVKEVEIAGSNDGPDGPFQPLAAATLAINDGEEEATLIPLLAELPVRWVRLTLRGGIDVQRDKTFFEFSEIIGRGRQAPVPLLDAFSGRWKGPGVVLELTQDGAAVSGCYDRDGRLAGTVAGNILRATGESKAGIPSSFVLTVTNTGAVDGVRSTNGAPFKRYTGASAPNLVTACSEAEPPTLGCGSVLHAIEFDFDSAAIRPESSGILDALKSGLAAASADEILILGHTSNEGAEGYNQRLSARRAEAVVEALAARGISPERMSAQGLGEARPIAENNTEAGRSLNRRVEILCR